MEDNDQRNIQRNMIKSDIDDLMILGKIERIRENTSVRERQEERLI